MDSSTIRLFATTAFIMSIFSSCNAMAQIGHVLDAVGPINQSMGGAGTALPLDSMGALHWNPASITGLSTELGFGFAAFAPQTDLSSRVEAGAFGPGIPPVAMEGTTASDTDINPIPSLGFVCSPEDSDWSYGLGGFAIGGFGVDFPASTTNPLLTPQRPNGLGFGAIFSQFQLMQFAPTVAYRWTDRISVGIAPTINWSTLAISPFSAATPNANGTYPSAAHTDAAWGLGYQLGIYFEDECSGWHAGMSYKSTQWFQTYKFNSQDHLGAPRQLVFDMDYPSILSLGVGYSGFERLSLAADVRYIDYENTEGFQAAGFDATGAVTGFGWESIWSCSLGGQYMVTDRLAWRLGYAFTENPINDAVTFYNTPAPAIVQHHLSTGFSYDMPDGWVFSSAFHYGFQNSISGQWQSPAGAIPNTSVTSRLSTYSLSAGIHKRF